MVATPTPPRLPPIPAEEWDEEARAMLRGRIKNADRYLIDGPDAPRMPNVLGVLAHHRELASAWLGYNGELLDRPALDPRHRELLILRVAWRTRSKYEWTQHVLLGQRYGLTDEQIRAIAGGWGILDGGENDVWTPLDRLLLAATDDLFDKYRIGDATWAALAEALDARQLLEVLFVVGSYLCVAMVFNSVDLELDPEMDPSLVPKLFATE